MSLTLAIALWGAVLGTLNTVAIFIRWLRSGARLRITVEPNKYYPDSVRVPDDSQQTEGLLERLKPSLHIEIVNTGDSQTTVTGIQLFYAKPDLLGRLGKERIGWDNAAIQPHLNQKLPVALAPGSVWSGRIDQELVLTTREHARFREMTLYIEITAAHERKRIQQRVFGPRDDFVSRRVAPRTPRSLGRIRGEP